MMEIKVCMRLLLSSKGNTPDKLRVKIILGCVLLYRYDPSVCTEVCFLSVFTWVVT
jgi:hypothetical protein